MGRCNGILQDAELPGESSLKKSSKTENRMNADSRMRNLATLVAKTGGPQPASELQGLTGVTAVTACCRAGAGPKEIKPEAEWNP